MFQSRSINSLVLMLGRNFRNCFFHEKSVLIEVIVRVMLMQTYSCFWKLETCLRVPTVEWTEIDRLSKICSEQK